MLSNHNIRRLLAHLTSQPGVTGSYLGQGNMAIGRVSAEPELSLARLGFYLMIFRLPSSGAAISTNTSPKVCKSPQQP